MTYDDRSLKGCCNRLLINSRTAILSESNHLDEGTIYRASSDYSFQRDINGMQLFVPLPGFTGRI